MDFAIIVAIITACAAVCAPTVSSIVQSITSLKLKKIESTYQTKIEIFRDFGKYFGKLNEEYSPENCALFYSAAYQTMLICNDKARIKIQHMICYMKETMDKAHSDDPKIRKEFRIYLNARFEECSELIYKDFYVYSFRKKKYSKSKQSENYTQIHGVKHNILARYFPVNNPRNNTEDKNHTNTNNLK